MRLGAAGCKCVHLVQNWVQRMRARIKCACLHLMPQTHLKLHLILLKMHLGRT